MIKQLLFVAFVIFCVLSQNAREGKVGGYSDVDPAAINSLESLAELQRIETVARDAYSAENNGA